MAEQATKKHENPTTPVQTERSGPATGTATVIIGCRLPSGITLEVGLQTREKNEDGKWITMVKRLENYERIVLKGWHHHNTTGLQMPAGVASDRPFLNYGVKKSAWEQWKAEHKNSWLLRNDVLFEAESAAEAQVKAMDAAQAPQILAPIKLSAEGKPIIDGKPAREVETADFSKERG